MTCSLKYPPASRRKLLFSLMEKLLTRSNLCYRRNPMRRKLHKARVLILQHKSRSLHFNDYVSILCLAFLFRDNVYTRLPSCTTEQKSNDLRKNLLSEQVFRYQSSRRCNMVEKSTEMVARFPLRSVRVTTSAADILPFLAWDSDHPSPLSAFHFYVD